MGHVTYEEQFIKTNDDFKYLLSECHPDFCKVCFSKMYLGEISPALSGTGPTAIQKVSALRTDFIVDGETQFEADGKGGANKVSVRPHIAQGTACGWGNTTSSVGANLWHATTWGNKESICQQDDTIDEAVETMFIRPSGKKDREVD